MNRPRWMVFCRALDDGALGAARVGDQRARPHMRIEHVQRLKNSFNGLGEINEIGDRGRLGEGQALRR